MQIQPQLFKLSDLLENRLFKIPDYQRAYSWGMKQRSDLFADIRRAHETSDDHFMATIVGLHGKEKQKIAADEYSIVYIVDGQQRLTTLVLLLKAIQKSLDSKVKAERKIQDELGELLVKGDELSLLLLQTNHDSSEMFADYLRDGKVPAEDASTMADQNIADAVRECEDFVSNWKKQFSLIDLIRVVRHRLWAIFHTVEDEALVYRVFEVLNSRGLEVNWIDKLKSQLMGLAFEAGPEAGRNQAINELRTIWQNIYGKIGKRKVLIAETVRFAGTLQAASAPARPLSEAAATQRLVEYAGTKPKKIVECAKWLQKVVVAEDALLSNYRWTAVTQIVQARLVALAILLSDYSKTEMQQVLDRWERVTFRIYGLSGMDARTKVGDYTRLAWRILNEKMTSKDAIKELSKIGKSFPIHDVIDNFDPSNCYEGWTESLRYLFFRYEEHLSAINDEKINQSQWSKIWADEPAKSIEHIKPQSSGASNVHHLGNLTMLPPGINSKLKDADPEEKANAYRTCGLRASIEVAELMNKRKWTDKQIESRAEKILNWAKSEWAD